MILRQSKLVSFQPKTSNRKSSFLNYRKWHFQSVLMKQKKKKKQKIVLQQTQVSTFGIQVNQASGPNANHVLKRAPSERGASFGWRCTLHQWWPLSLSFSSLQSGQSGLLSLSFGLSSLKPFLFRLVCSDHFFDFYLTFRPLFLSVHLATWSEWTHGFLYSALLKHWSDQPEQQSEK